jgi:light-harvesting complex 1 beta chain
MADTNSWSGLSDQEAQEFHTYYLQGTMLFTAVAVVAHILVWLWRPWIPPATGYPKTADALDAFHSVATVIQTLVG